MECVCVCVHPPYTYFVLFNFAKISSCLGKVELYIPKQGFQSYCDQHPFAHNLFNQNTSKMESKL